jgi:glycosyltransferase involved in cell wall biosynthesis
MTRNIAWIFPLGHGHAAQFLNFRDSCPPEIDERSIWVGLDFAKSDDWLANLRYVPTRLQRARHEMWHFRRQLGTKIKLDDALFVASWNLRFVPHMRRHPSYFYVDFSPSLMRGMSPWYDHFYRKSALVQAGRELLARALPRSARAIFAMSRWCANGVKKDYGIEPARVHVVPGGANLKRWHYADRSGHSGKVRILFVGGELRRKGGEHLLSWAEQASPGKVQVDIVTWAGQLPVKVNRLLGNPGPFDVSSRDLGPWLPHVCVHLGLKPNMPELQALFESADIFCLPTQADFSSIASLEAMATGLPVVVGGVGGIPELIEHGKTGFLVEPGDVKTLSQALQPLIEDRALRLNVGRAARQACEQQFNTERQLREIVQIIDADLAKIGTRHPISGFFRRASGPELKSNGS